MSERYIEPFVDGSIPLDPMDLIAICMEQDSNAVLIDEGQLPAALFDLSSGVAGELVQKLTNYGIRMAAVVPEPGGYSQSFQDFAREATRSRIIRFFPNRQNAVEWLASAG